MLIAGKVATYLVATALMTSQEPLKVPLNELGCMVESIHFEARGESQAGKRGVANVILNRVDSKRFGDTICEVVHASKQFSYRNDNDKPEVKIKNDIEFTSFKETVNIALKAVQGTLKDNTGGADHYLAPSKLKRLPRWYSSDKVTVSIGDHTFLKL